MNLESVPFFMKRLLFLLFLMPLVLFSQEREIFEQNGTGTYDNLNNPTNEKEVSVKGEKPPITDYLIITQKRDTTHLDTTLTMAKDFKFNFFRKDDFEYIPFHNVGQPYNQLGKSFDLDLLSPRMGSQARHQNYYEIDDILDYYVPTPLTDLYFKTVVNQGQQLEALFTSNLSPQFNFSISYKGVRSAGDYINTLTSSGNFKFTSNYTSKNKRYRLRVHTVFQDHFNEENGGLEAASLQGFIDDTEDLSNRGRLEPNLTDAESTLDGKRFYIDHDYELIGDKDSTSYYSGRIYNKAYYEDKFYRYSQDTADEDFLGESYISTNLEDKTNLEEGMIEAGASYEHHLLGYYKAGVARHKYNYGYDRLINQASGVINNRLIGELYQFKAEFAKRVGKFDITANGGVNITGDLDGQFINSQASYKFKDFDVKAGIAISSRAPDFIYTLHQSDYINYNWQNNFNNTEKQEFNFRINSEKFLNAQVTFTTLQDHVYFSQNLVVDTDGNTTGYNATPIQTTGDITYLKIKVNKDIKFLRKFGLDNTIMYQNVTQTDDVINVPDFTARSTFYYKNRLFKNALLLQTGITAKYFTKYYMDGYDPVLGEFYSQNTDELGGFPMVDLFVNAKIRQTRIFFKLEHANQLFASNTDYFSAPRNPYRDFTIRFGLVWNFFL
ncbi:putative beta-barrel porin [Nonlabens xylanidelens]|uniref:Putative beta-barrel porin n=2 Tax=Nonlabens xylanidelens TaxID=191564 RepID=A0A2S6ILM3_9FLAO|nr:putative beta-barrel porin [Nonlabens xylanidelens]